MSKKIQNECGFLSQPRKSKRRQSSRRSPTPHEAWYNNGRDSQEPSEDEVPGMDYSQMYWQQHRPPQTQPHPALHNGQRLFTAMSDPSVCGYSAVPVTYAMEPVSLPPMYHLYQPVVRPNYRTYRGGTRTSAARMSNGPLGIHDNAGNGYSSLQENGWTHCTPMAYQNGDYTSLPPTANIDNKNNGEELNSEHRRYSDPGLGPADLPDDSKGEDSDSSESGSSITTVDKNNKMFLSLLEQMTKMKEINSQLYKDLHEAKTDLETVKTELNQLKQNVPSEYQPGMLTDIIKEIRDANRAKEEAMLSKMKQLMESQQCQKSVELEQLKSQLDAVTRASDERVVKLENEIAALRLGLKAKQQQQQQLRRPSAAAAAMSSSSSSGGGDDDDADDDRDSGFNYGRISCNDGTGPTKGPVTDL
ncbi:uncharacterized protein LOC131670497 isoform X3 [Phymastichus coffea]|uniref:uncharacterized protein LOC131670497 isoform X3 n=1 Tax=Phymastichus coffea TaxID=108790 RepID=UPI00273CB0AF|nr:uncharacterized protein LOC131670497 isoform X3 [Phymastichus coffea]